jgi:hypothetical protein
LPAIIKPKPIRLSNLIETFYLDAYKYPTLKNRYINLSYILSIAKENLYYGIKSKNNSKNNGKNTLYIFSRNRKKTIIAYKKTIANYRP